MVSSSCTIDSFGAQTWGNPEKWVFLKPCCHRISEVAAHKLYGNINEEQFVKISNRCPICKRMVIGHYPDQAANTVAQKIIGSIKETELKQKSSEETSVHRKIHKFVLKNGDWSIYDSGAYLVRYLTFRSDSPESLFYEMQVLGYRDGSVAINVLFEAESEIVRKLFSELYIGKSADLLFGTYQTKNHDELKNLFSIFTKYNEIPKAKLSLITSLVERGSWDTVTPLGPGEKLPPHPSASLSSIDYWP